ncbi:HlyC/CorC family transporter, partial [Rubripirellula sp.]|nr:HlyC/CorC family transporter [Rubripirellula sp.]
PESDDYETIAGYVLFHVGAIPKAGERLVIENTEIEILKASVRKIDSMRIHRIDEQDQKAG